MSLSQEDIKSLDIQEKSEAKYDKKFLEFMKNKSLLIRNDDRDCLLDKKNSPMNININLQQKFDSLSPSPLSKRSKKFESTNEKLFTLGQIFSTGKLSPKDIKMSNDISNNNIDIENRMTSPKDFI